MANVSTPRFDASVASPSSDVVLTNTSNYTQVLTPSADINVDLPSTGISIGSVFLIRNTSTTNQLSINASDSSNIENMYQGHIRLVAKVNNPGTNTDWDVIEIIEKFEKALDSEFSGETLTIVRNGGEATAYHPLVSHAVAQQTATTTTGFVPARLRPSQDVYNVNLVSLGDFLQGSSVQADGEFRIFYVQTSSGSGISRTSGVSGFVSWVL